ARLAASCGRSGSCASSRLPRRCSEMSVNIKKGDQVRVIAGNDKGVEGKVIAVEPRAERVIVEGVNRVKRHTRSAQRGGPAGAPGGIVTKEAPIHASNVMLVVDADGEKV